MAKNLIPQIAQMLGVELNEEFKIKGREGVIYKFIVDGLIVSDDDAEKVYTTANMPLIGLVRGDAEIVKMPWKPKKGEKYWGFWYSSVDDAWLVLLYTWANNPADFALYKAGWVYRTRAEAEAALPAVAAEMGVEYKL